jgi:hypothetical protein
MPLTQVNAGPPAVRICALTELCDRALASKAVNARARFSFCPNHPSIEEHILAIARL